MMEISSSSKYFEIVRLGTADARDYQRLRLSALAKTPEAFGVTWDEQACHSAQQIAMQLENGSFFGAKYTQSSSLVGIVSLRVPEAEKVRHKAVLSETYVCPEARGAGIGMALVAYALDDAARKVEEVKATVFLSNLPTLKLYRHFGFRQYGLEKRALKIGDRYYHRALLALPLYRRVTFNRRQT